MSYSRENLMPVLGPLSEKEYQALSQWALARLVQPKSLALSIQSGALRLDQPRATQSKEFARIGAVLVGPSLASAAMVMGIISHFGPTVLGIATSIVLGSAPLSAISLAGRADELAQGSSAAWTRAMAASSSRLSAFGSVARHAANHFLAHGPALLFRGIDLARAAVVLGSGKIFKASSVTPWPSSKKAIARSWTGEDLLASGKQRWAAAEPKSWTTRHALAAKALWDPRMLAENLYLDAAIQRCVNRLAFGDPGDHCWTKRQTILLTDEARQAQVRRRGSASEAIIAALDAGEAAGVDFAYRPEPGMPTLLQSIASLDPFSDFPLPKLNAWRVEAIAARLEAHSLGETLPAPCPQSSGAHTQRRL